MAPYFRIATMIVENWLRYDEAGSAIELGKGANYLPTMCWRSLLFSWQMYSSNSSRGDQGMV